MTKILCTLGIFFISIACEEAKKTAELEITDAFLIFPVDQFQSMNAGSTGGSNAGSNAGSPAGSTAGSPAGSTTMGDGIIANASGDYHCVEIYHCRNQCQANDSGCLQRCFDAGTTEAQSKYNAFYSCASQRCPQNDQSCLTICSNEWSNCELGYQPPSTGGSSQGGSSQGGSSQGGFGGDFGGGLVGSEISSCNDLVSCLSDCGGDYFCEDDCHFRANAQASNAFDNLQSCVTFSSCNADNFEICIQENCANEYEACFGFSPGGNGNSSSGSHTSACDILDQSGCPFGEICSLDSIDSSGNPINVCLSATTVVGHVNDACMSNDSTYGSCSPDLLCGTVSGAQHCYAYCDEMDLDACSPEQGCVSLTSDFGGSFGICLGECSALDQSHPCGMNEHCIPLGFGKSHLQNDMVIGKCIAIPAQIKQESESCTYNESNDTHDCAPGMICADDDGDGNSNCLRLCEQGQLESCPNPNHSQCSFIFQNARQIGICVAP